MIFALVLVPIALMILLGFVLKKQYPPVSKADAALVFGTGIEWKARSRWLQAVRLYQAGCFPYLIVSGGVPVPGQPFTEAEWFRDQLAAMGIPPERILLENQARTTYENTLFSLPILQEHQFHSVILIMSDFAGFRAYLNAKKTWQDSSTAIYTAHAPSGRHWSPWTWWLSAQGWKLTRHEVRLLLREGLLRYW